MLAGCSAPVAASSRPSRPPASPPATRSPPPSCRDGAVREGAVCEGSGVNRFGIPVEGKGIRQLCGAVLVFEAIVIVLAIPVAIVLEHANRGLAGGVGGGLALCAVLIGGLVGRPRKAWALVAGTILQALIIAAGVIVPAMYSLGAIFAVLWFTGIWLARRHATPPTSP